MCDVVNLNHVIVVQLLSHVRLFSTTWTAARQASLNILIGIWICWQKKSNRKLLLFSIAAAAKSPQSCPTLCDPGDGSPPGYPVPGILQARTLEWVAISFSNAWKWEVKVKLLSRVRLFTTPWTAAHQAPLLVLG